jgi:hypothetical protein
VNSRNRNTTNKEKLANKVLQTTTITNQYSALEVLDDRNSFVSGMDGSSESNSTEILERNQTLNQDELEDWKGVSKKTSPESVEQEVYIMFKDQPTGGKAVMRENLVEYQL